MYLLKYGDDIRWCKKYGVSNNKTLGLQEKYGGNHLFTTTNHYLEMVATLPCGEWIYTHVMIHRYLINIDD